MIVLADAVVDPLAVVVESLHTYVAHVTVARVRNTKDFTGWT